MSYPTRVECANVADSSEPIATDCIQSVSTLYHIATVLSPVVVTLCPSDIE